MTDISFDDLIPGARRTQQGTQQPQSDLSFDDLIPKAAAPTPTAPPTPAAATPQAAAPAEEGQLDFSDLLPGATPKEGPSALDYLREFGKRFVKGAAEQGASTLRGYGAILHDRPGIESGMDLGPQIQEPPVYQPTGTPVTENPLYRAGQAASAAIESALPDRNILNPVVGDIASGFGSVAGNIGTAMIPGIGPGLAALTIPGAGMGEAAERAVKAGATPEQQQRAAMFGTAPGATDFVDALLPSLGSTGKVLGLIKRVGLRVLEGAFVEGGQEGLQQFLQNLIAKKIYKPDQDLMEDVPYNALIGGIVGGATSGLIGGHGKKDIGSIATPGEVARTASILRGEEPSTISQSTERIGERAPTFFSNLARVVEDKLPSSADASQVINTLRGASGVREEEIQALQLPQYLFPEGENRRVSKDDLLEHLHEQRIRVHEVARTLDNSDINDFGEATAGTTQYSEYRPPGASKNYTELLLTLGNARVDEAKSLAQRSDDELYAFRDLMIAKYDRRLGLMSPEDAARYKQLADAQVLNYKAYENLSKREQYTGSHFKEPDVLAHVRFSHRVDASGNPMLFIEEMQSDWAQNVRKYGVQGDEKTLGEAADRAIAGDPARGFSRAGVVAALRKLQPPPMPHFGATNDWTGLVFKRMLREAADRGFTRIGWTNGDLAARYAAGGAENRADVVSGLRKYYDQIVPSVAKKWAKKLGGTIGETRVETDINYYRGATIQPDPTFQGRWSLSVPGDPNPHGLYDTREDAQRHLDEINSTGVGERVMHIEIPPQAWGTIQRGLPLFQKEGINPKPQLVGAQPERFAPLIDAAQRSIHAIQAVAKRMGINENLSFELHEGTLPGGNTDAMGHMQHYLISNKFVIRVNLSQVYSPMEMYAVLAHEFGHVVQKSAFQSAPAEVQLHVSFAYAKWFAENKAGSRQFLKVATARDNAARIYSRNPIYNEQYASIRNSQLSPEQFDYHLGMDEWFAEQVAKWATASEPAITHFEKFFKSLGQRIREIVTSVQRRLGVEVRPNAALEGWLNSFLKEDAKQQALAGIAKGAEWTVQKRMQDALGLYVPAAPPQGPEVVTLNMATNALGATNPQLQNMAAHAGRMNWFYKWFAGLDQLRDANPQFTPLVNYYEHTRQMHGEEATVQDAAMRITKDWQKLGPQADNLAAFLNDLAHMSYRTPQEVANGVERQPTQQEIAALVQKHKLSDDALRASQKVKSFMDTFLKLIERMQIVKLQRRITDPIALGNEITKVRAAMAQVRQRPYFPFMWFGDHFVSVRNAAGDIVHFETFERSLLRSAEAKQRRKVADLNTKFPGHDIRVGVLPESAGHFVGMPPLLLDSIQGDLQLTPDAIEAIRQIRHGLSPTTALRSSMQYRPMVPGYSMDFRRSFAKFAFYGARYYAKGLFTDILKQDLQDAARVGGINESKVSRYMAHHFQSTVIDARGDFGIFKGAIFLWAMGYVPAAATQNLSQTPMITLPFLGAKYGDIRATRAILRAMSSLDSFYKKGKYDNATDFELRALGYGIKTGRISETQAPELAGISQGAGLLLGAGGNRAQRVWAGLQEKAAFMFEMAEQFNRRVAYRAALNLALENPNAKGVTEAITKYGQEYQELLSQFTPAQAKAIIAANHAVDQTQYVYARYARPRVFQGRMAGTILVFKKYMQSTLFMLAHNKGDVLPRYLVIAALAGGLGGIPGHDDFVGMIRLFMVRAFGRDFDPDRWVREQIKQFFPGGSVPPDLVLHGLARYGMGLPALLDMMGNLVTGKPGRGFDPALVAGNPSKNWAPVLDRSRALSMGNILPVEYKLFMPTKDVNATIADQTQKASGAAFSVAFNMYKAIMDSQLEVDDRKRYERAVPRILGSVSKAFRTLTEGRERLRGGPNAAATFLNYDWRDPSQAMEMLAIAAGYQTLRNSYKWDRVISELEVEKFWEFRKNGLLGEMHDAVVSRDEARRLATREKIIQFNESLPDHARGYKISSDTIERSMKTRERERISKEAGVPTKKINAPIAEYFNQLYPGAVTDVRRVR